MMKSFIALLLGCLSSACYAQIPCPLPCNVLITGTGPPGPPGVVPLPGGRLTLVSGKPVMDADWTSSTVWYAPYNSDSYPALDATLTWQTVRFSASPVDQAGASLTGGSKWTAGTSRDIFGTGSGAICSGPAWPASDRASRLLVRYNGIDVNSAAMTCDTSASSSVSCPQYQCTFLGSINSSVAGQLTAQFGYGQNRVFETWTAYSWNQIDIILHTGVILATGTFKPTNQYPAWAPYNNDPLNRANVFTGLPTLVDVTYHQNSFINSSIGGPTAVLAMVLWDGVNSGFTCIGSSDTSTVAGDQSCAAHYLNSASVGLHTATMGVAKANAASSTLFSGNGSLNNAPTPPYSVEGNSVLFARFKG